jgi:hypothetical protein
MPLVIRLPFDDAITSRDATTNKDALTTNAFFDQLGQEQVLVKRPGLQNLTSALGLGVQGALGIGLGIFFYEDVLYSFNSVNPGTEFKGFITDGNILLTAAYENLDSVGDRVVYITRDDEIKVKPLPDDFQQRKWGAMVYTGTRFIVEGVDEDLSNEVRIAYSTDGNTWTQTTAPYLGGEEFQSGAIAGSTIVMVDSGMNYTIVSTDNGSTWTGHNPALAVPDNISDIASNGTNRFTSGQYYSADGINWIACTGTTANATNPIIWNGTFFLHNDNDIMYKSTDGIAWTTPATTGLVPTRFAWSDTLNRYAGFAESGGTTYAVYSTDGLNWITGLTQGFPIPGLITFFNGSYYGLSQVDTAVSGAPFNLTFVLKSTNGITWIAYAIDIALFDETPTLVDGLV